MDIRNCKNCGAMFQYVGKKICPKCVHELEGKLQEVKAYLDEHKRATVMEVSEAVDVSVKQLHRWVQEERLMFAPGINTGVVCQKCGIPIEKGTMCAKCSSKLKNDLEGAVNKPKVTMNPDKMKNSNARMHLSRYDQSK